MHIQTHIHKHSKIEEQKPNGRWHKQIQVPGTTHRHTHSQTHSHVCSSWIHVAHFRRELSYFLFAKQTSLSSSGVTSVCCVVLVFLACLNCLCKMSLSPVTILIPATLLLGVDRRGRGRESGM